VLLTNFASPAIHCQREVLARGHEAGDSKGDCLVPVLQEGVG
jgi:hypothetical protein